MGNTLFTGKVLLHFDELPSTNDYAADWLAGVHGKDATKSRPPEGSVVRADSQSAGRGQFGSKWESAQGQNLMFSVIYYPAFLPVEDQFLLSQAVALAVADTVRMYVQAPVFIKWPNDIYVSDYKVAGILIQNALAGKSIRSSILGIGLNVNQTEFSDGLKRAGSLARSTGLALDREAVFNDLLVCLEARYLELRSGQFATIRSAYLSFLYQKDVKQDFELPDGTRFSGCIRGVRPDGQLQIEWGGALHAYAVKAVQMVWE
jgi:BirA family biotin operon repressor/biotin-[acetyl-CoA-carboxylase] ligase